MDRSDWCKGERRGGAGVGGKKKKKEISLCQNGDKFLQDPLQCGWWFKRCRGLISIITLIESEAGVMGGNLFNKIEASDIWAHTLYSIKLNCSLHLYISSTALGCTVKCEVNLFMLWTKLMKKNSLLLMYIMQHMDICGLVCLDWTRTWQPLH